ncbi:MAG TPA: type IV pilus secretin PilQ [Terriglobia bacterium]|nr:type IV pilus secretin PilQ [Terriglobia bacterium]
MKTRINILSGVAAAALVALTCVAVHERGPGRWATLEAVHVASVGNDCRVSLSIAGPCGYQISRSGTHILILGLDGAKAGNLLRTVQEQPLGLFQAYRITTVKSEDGSPAIEVQIETRSPVRFSVQNEGPGLGLVMKPLDINLDGLPLVTPSAASVLALLLPTGLFQSYGTNAGSRAMRSGVSIHRIEKQRTLVSFNTSNCVESKTLRPTHPPRLVADIANAPVSTKRPAHKPDEALFKETRAAEHRSRDTKAARVVVEPTGQSAVNIHLRSTGVQKELKAVQSPKTPRLAAVDTALAKAKSDYEKQTLAVLKRPVKVTLDGGSQTVQVPNNKRIRLAEKTAPKAMPITARHTRVEASQPRLAQAPLDFADTLPVRSDWQNVDSAPYNDPPSILPTALAAMKAAQAVAGSGSQAPPLVVHPTGTAKPGTSTQYTGELISLNLKDVDLKDFFRLIHEISGLNVILDPNVSGTVTLVLDDVPWDEALEIVLKNNGLGKQLEGNVLRIARIGTLTAEEESATKLKDAQEKAAPLVTIFRALHFAQAIDVKTTSQIQGLSPPPSIPGVVTILNSEKDSVLTRRGLVVADPRDNAVIITDVPGQIPVIEAMIDKLDRKPKQISIEARIVQANADFTRQLSSVLAAAVNNKSFGTSAATGTNLLSVAPPQPPFPALALATQPLSVGNTGFGAFAITDATARYAINAALSAAETRDQAKIISRPTIVTQNNVAGSVQQGVQIPIQTNINNTISVQYVNATLQLGVIPQVTEGGHIFLNIVVNNASVGALLSFAGPSINTQQATTQVLVPDGGTVVFGGITVTNRNRSATYVPLLGSIPIIGNLFKSSSVNTQDQELLFFVSPKILPDNS